MTGTGRMLAMSGAETKGQDPSTSLTRPARREIAEAAWHGLFWLAGANAVGAMLAVLLLVPAGNRLLGEWTYGRWMMVHMNLELYGWTSLPLVGFLFRAYDVPRTALARWQRPALCVWSVALAVGCLSWLEGHSSGKLFLDWTGYSRVLFAVALLGVWLVLLGAWIEQSFARDATRMAAWFARLAGLLVLVAVPVVLYLASGPDSYPAVNPDTGGPTGASQLESSLAIVLIVLMLPLGIARRVRGRDKAVWPAWLALVAETVLCAALDHGDISHRRPAQYLSLGCLLIWVPLTPAYYRAFAWHDATRQWRRAFLGWWGVLVVSGWVFFLPGVLDHFKFTDGLVGHSFVAMAGFTSSLILFVLVQMLGEDAWVLNRARSFHLWNWSVVAYVIVVTIAGWREGSDPAFTIVSGAARNALYVLRLLSGVLMLIASVDWLIDTTALLRVPAEVHDRSAREKTA